MTGPDEPDRFEEVYAGAVQRITDDQLERERSAETRGLWRAVRIMIAIMIAGLLVGGYLIVEVSGQAAYDVAQDLADEERQQRIAAIEAGRAQDRRQYVAEFAAINAQREAEGLDPVPVPPPPDVDPELGVVDVEQVAELAAARVLAQIRPGLSAAQVTALVASSVQSAVGSIPVPEDGADGTDGADGVGVNGTNGVDGQPGAGVALVELVGCNLRITLTSGDVFEVGPVCGPPGADGVPGPGPTPEQLEQAVVDYLAENPLNCPDGTTAEQLTVLTPDGGTRDIVACVPA